MQNDMTLDDIHIRTELKVGDLGFVITAHTELYEREFNYGLDFEYYVIQKIAEFCKNYDPDKERVWVCEHQGKKIGFLLLMNQGTAAQLRFFFIDAAYRGIGLGKKLMQLFVDFLKEKNYKSCFLWTTIEQVAAAKLYQNFGFQKVEEKPSNGIFGKSLLELKYELVL